MNNVTRVRGPPIWVQLLQVLCQRWVHVETVAGQAVPIPLMEEAAHTAHSSIGGSTKLALDDAIELARCLTEAANTTDTQFF